MGGKSSKGKPQNPVTHRTRGENLPHHDPAIKPTSERKPGLNPVTSRKYKSGETIPDQSVKQALGLDSKNSKQ